MVEIATRRESTDVKMIETSRKAGENAPSPRDERNPRNWLHEYNVGKTLGQGSFGKVKLGIHKVTGQQVALKFIDHIQLMKTRYASKFYREMEIHKGLDHPNVVKLYQIVEAPEVQFTCIIMEYIEGSDLLDVVLNSDGAKLSPKIAGKYFAQLLTAVQYLHSQGVVHRDLKLENIMLDSHSNEIKIIDFGFSNWWTHSTILKTSCGSPLYAAPEILLRKSYIGPEVDIWSLGVVLYSMLTGTIPWAGETASEQLMNTCQGRWIVTKQLPGAVFAILADIFTVDPTVRITIDELIENSWVSSFANKPKGIRKMMRRLSFAFSGAS